MNRLIAVHAPAATLGDDTLLTSVELWTDCVFVHLARGATDEMRREWDEFADAAMAARREGAEMPLPPSFSVGADLRLADDAGTAYEPRSGASGGFPDDPVRALWRFEPGVPPTASRLTIALGDAALELVL